MAMVVAAARIASRGASLPVQRSNDAAPWPTDPSHSFDWEAALPSLTPSEPLQDDGDLLLYRGRRARGRGKAVMVATPARDPPPPPLREVGGAPHGRERYRSVRSSRQRHPGCIGGDT